MVDVNKIVREILGGIDGVKVTYYYPNEFNNLPIISYYELTTTTGMRYDNAEQAQVSTVVVDVWGSGGGECSRLAVKVDAAMQNNGWYREFSRDMPPDGGVYHKTMRFSKSIFYKDEEE